MREGYLVGERIPHIGKNAVRSNTDTIVVVNVHNLLDSLSEGFNLVYFVRRLLGLFNRTCYFLYLVNLVDVSF